MCFLSPPRRTDVGYVESWMKELLPVDKIADSGSPSVIDPLEDKYKPSSG